MKPQNVLVPTPPASLALPINRSAPDPKLPYATPVDVPAEEWNRAMQRFGALLPLTQKKATVAEVKEAATALGLRLSRCYKLLARLKVDPSPMALVKRQTGADKGKHALDGRVEEIIKNAIDEALSAPETHRLAEIHVRVALACRSKKLPVPARSTVASRLNAIPKHEQTRIKHGKRVADMEHGPVRGSLVPTAPLQLVEVDHTRADVLIRDPETGLIIGRPWVSFSIDVCTRVVLGYYLTFDAPSATTLACCIGMMALDKAELLQSLELTGEWLVFGIPGCIFVDNGADMRSEAMRRGCHANGIELTYRPPGQPNYGGHIERLIGTFAKQFHHLPGTTGSNVLSRRRYKSEAHASMSFRQLERWLVATIMKYHNSVHRVLGRTPLAAWEAGGGPDLARQKLITREDRERFFVSFLPREIRTVQPEGINLFGQTFRSEILLSRVGQRLAVHYDTRDDKQVYVVIDKDTYFRAANTDPAPEGRSFAEATFMRLHRDDESRSPEVAARFDDAASQQGAIVQEARSQGKPTRKGRRRRTATESHTERKSMLTGQDKAPPTAVAPQIPLWDASQEIPRYDAE